MGDLSFLSRPFVTSSRMQEVLFVLFAVAVGTLALFHPTILSGFALVQTDPGDTRWCNYTLEHCYQWISGNPVHGNLLDCPIFFPVTNTATYSELLLGSAPIYWFWRLLGFLPDTSFQLWMIALGILNFLCSWLLFRCGLRFSPVAAVGGAYLFSFASMRATQLNYQQLLPQFFTMAALFCLCKMFDASEQGESAKGNRRWVWPVLFVLSAAAQVPAGIYLGFFLFLGILLTLGVSLFFAEPRRAVFRMLRANRLPLLAAAVAVAPLFGWMAYHYGSARTLLGARSWPEVALMIPQAKSWIDMGPLSYAYPWLGAVIDFSTLPNEAVHRIGLGFLTTAVAIAGFRALLGVPWGKVIVSCTILLILTAFLYPGDWSPWYLVFQYLPGADIIRVVTRISFLVLIAVAVSVAFFLNRVRNAQLALVLLVLVGAEQAQTTVAYNKYATRARIQRIAGEIPKNCRSYYCVFQKTPISGMDYWVYAQMDAMWAQLATNIPTANGFSGNMPLGWAPLSVQVFFDSPWDLLRARINAFQWADLNGLKRGDICVVPILYSPLSGKEPDLTNLELAPGTPQSETCFGPGWGEDEPDGDQIRTWAIDDHAKVFVPLLSGVPYTMSMTVAAAPGLSREQTVSLALNGVPIASLPISTQVGTYRVMLPKEAVSDLNKLEFAFGQGGAQAGLARDQKPREGFMALFKLNFAAIPDERTAEPARP